MTITVTTTGDFDLELYGYQTDMPESLIRKALADLAGFARSWDVTVHDPDEHDPNGRLTIQHSSYNEHTTIEIASRETDHSITYDVYNPMETDILTRAEDVPLPEAVRIAVETANAERRRQSTILPPYRISFLNALNRARP